MSTKRDEIKRANIEILKAWLVSCTRGKKLSRNTIAIGVVVLDHLRKKQHVSKADVTSSGGEVKGARSGLPKILEQYGIPGSFLKEVTTRQAHPDGLHLFENLKWGKTLDGLSNTEREETLLEMVGVLRARANDWLKRKNLIFEIPRRQAPTAWIHMIIENARSRSGGVVEQHLIGAKLEKRFKAIQVPNHPAHAADAQTSREGDYRVSELVYHVTAAPNRSVIEKCRSNIERGLRPILLVPSGQEPRARFIAEDEGLDEDVTVFSIESFVSLNIIELAAEEQKDAFAVLKEILDIYNRRLSEVETDLSLQIEIR